jgi:hypothetical protein
MDKSKRSRMALGGVGLLLAALVGAGGTVAATRGGDVGSVLNDETDATDTAQAATQVLARRIVINGVPDPGVKLLAIPGLGVLKAACRTNEGDAAVRWTNTSGGPVDFWSDNGSDGHTRPVVKPANAADVLVGYWVIDLDYQIGTQLDLGQGNSPGPRRTASISIRVYRSGSGAPCGFQATAMTWHTP